MIVNTLGSRGLCEDLYLSNARMQDLDEKGGLENLPIAPHRDVKTRYFDESCIAASPEQGETSTTQEIPMKADPPEISVEKNLYPLSALVV